MHIFVEVSEVEKVVIAYETHAGRSGAATTFAFAPEPLVEPTFIGGGTHRKYLTMVRKGTEVTVTRVSNRGNVTVRKVVIDKPVFIDFLGNSQDLDPALIEYAKRRGLI